MSNIFESFWDWFLGLFGGGGDTYDPHRLPAWQSDLNVTKGYGVVNHWWKLSDDENRRGLNAMADAGCNRYKIEFLGAARDRAWENMPMLAEKFRALYRLTHERRIVLDATIVNWNMGGGGVPENGDVSICEARFGDALFLDALNAIKGVGVEGISLCAVSEWGPHSRNSRCWAKAAHWNDLLGEDWQGMKTWNRESRPTSAPTGFGIEYHPNSTNDVGSACSLVVTDTSGILRQLCRGGDIRAPFIPDVAAAYVRKVRAAGRGCVLYGFGHTAFDLPTIAALKDIP